MEKRVRLGKKMVRGANINRVSQDIYLKDKEEKEAKGSTLIRKKSSIAMIANGGEEIDR